VSAVKSQEAKKMTARILSPLLAMGVCLLIAAPSALAAAPALRLTATSQPTNFTAGAAPSEASLETIYATRRLPQYSLIATNVGSTPTSGPIIFTDTLPADLTPIAPGARDMNFRFFENPEISCGVSGQTVTCTDPFPLQPGRWAQFLVPVKVAEDAPPSVTNKASVRGGGAIEATATATTTIGSSIPSFDFLAAPDGFAVDATGADGGPATQAGSHPGQLTLDFGFPSIKCSQCAEGVIGGEERLISSGHLKDLKVRLPRGMVVDPDATPVRCTEAQFEMSRCPDASAIGVATVLSELQGAFPTPSALFNMVPPPGKAAEFAFDAVNIGIYVHVMGGVNSAGEYELGSDTDNVVAREGNPVLGAQIQLWGHPSDTSHDAMRGGCVGTIPGERNELCPLADPTSAPFLTMPGSCSGTLSATASASDWEEPASFHDRSTELEDSLGNPTVIDGCDKLDFAPEIEARPTTDLADAPSGLEFNLHVPQDEGPENLATANFKDVQVTLPEGMTVNPSSANGQDACSSAQIGLSTPVGQKPIRFTEDPASCPQAAKLGSVEVDTPLLDHPLRGAVYLAKPFDNPFNSLLAIYLDVEDPQTGVVSKLAGRVDPDPQTGQLTTTFSENPELPIEDVKLNLFNGPGAALKTPLACGEYSVASDITPWSAPEGADATPSDSFQTSVAPDGGACPSSEAQAPNRPSFTAGTIAPQAGAYSPFVLKLSREDGTQRLTSIDTILPKGLLGKLAGIGYCSEAQIAQAKSREAPRLGAVELAGPSCPSTSEVGTVIVGAGAGPNPYYVQGHAYLAGPYKGAPLSLVIITPAVAGPFDLGTVVVRTALYVDSESAQIHAVSDPLPTIIDGIPLDLRSVVLRMDRPEFTLNPTSCDPTAITGSLLAATGQSAALTSPFQVGGCDQLKFKPKLKLSLKGSTRHAGHPALKAVLTYPQGGGYANIARAQVNLPHSEFIDQGNLNKTCTKPVLLEGKCPTTSIYGKAKAWTPLLEKPLEGPVYLVGGYGYKLPALVAELNGQIRVVLKGKVDSGLNKGIRNTFEAVPDAPVSRFVLEMKGGKKYSLLENSEDLCRKPQRAIARFTAQNGLIEQSKPLIANSCGKAKHKKARSHKARR
jgi:hypothetical protein